MEMILFGGSAACLIQKSIDIHFHDTCAASRVDISAFVGLDYRFGYRDPIVGAYRIRPFMVKKDGRMPFALTT